MKVTENLLCAVSFGFPLQMPGVLWFLSGHAQGPPVTHGLLTLGGKFTAVGICCLPRNCLSVSWVPVLCSVTWSLSLHVAHTCNLWHKNVAATYFFSVARNLQSRCNVNLPKASSHCAHSFILNHKICKQIKHWWSEACIIPRNTVCKHSFTSHKRIRWWQCSHLEVLELLNTDVSFLLKVYSLILIAD